MEYIEAEFRDQASPEVQAMFDALHDSGARIVHTIHEILDLSTIEAGGFELYPGEIHLKQLIDQVVRELRLRADQKGLYLDVEYGVRDDRIQGDAYSLEQALVNLVDNAIKYTEEGGVTLQLSEHRSELILSIQDTGIGMSKTYQRRMWESFSQESTGYTKKFQGVGLGLALVKRYCDLNQVDIDVFSQKGVGSTFTLTFKKPRGKSEGKQPKHHEDRE
ncbi:MAG: sensor histidine kinase [Candidatus Neomarinimicrobiota bacterium]|nr:MAG: sensor histidine kinase [Candidatus Neomarinimicrobiota bacterium]